MNTILDTSTNTLVDASTNTIVDASTMGREAIPEDRPCAEGLAPRGRNVPWEGRSTWDARTERDHADADRRRSYRFQGREGLAALRRCMQVSTDRPDELQAAAHSARFGAVRLIGIRHGALRARLGRGGWAGFRPESRGPAERSHIHVLVVLDGEVTVHVDGVGAVLRARDAARLDGGEPTMYETTDKAMVLGVEVDASEPRFAATLESQGFAVWRHDSVVPSAVAKFLCEVLCRDDENLAPAVRAELVPLVEQACLGLLTTRAPDVESARIQYDRALVLQYVTAHHADADLSPGSIAAHFGVSTRTLHRMFEDDDHTVMQWIAHVRLEEALMRLRNPKYATMPLEELAGLTGHGSALSLRRAVQAVTGMSPTQYRRRHLAEGTDERDDVA